MNIYREVVNRIEIPALPSLENGYYLLRFERNGTTSNVYAVVENESGMGVPITASVTEIGTGTPDPEAGEVLLAPGAWTLFFYEQVSGTNTNPDCSTIPLGQTEVTVYGEDAAVLSQTPTSCPSGPGGGITSVNGDSGPAVQLDAPDIPFTPFVSLQAGTFPGAYRATGLTGDGEPWYKLAGAAGPIDDGNNSIFYQGSNFWAISDATGSKMYQGTGADLLTATWTNTGDGALPLPTLVQIEADDVQAAVEEVVSEVAAKDRTGNTLWVDAVYGNNSRAMPSREDRPYSTIAAAIAASVSGQVVDVGPGAYAPDTNIWKTGVRIHARSGAVITAGATLFSDAGVSGSMVISGEGDWLTEGSAIVNHTGGSTMSITCRRFEHTDPLAAVIAAEGAITVNAESFSGVITFTSGSTMVSADRLAGGVTIQGGGDGSAVIRAGKITNGFFYAVDPVGTHYIEVDCPHIEAQEITNSGGIIRIKSNYCTSALVYLDSGVTEFIGTKITTATGIQLQDYNTNTRTLRLIGCIVESTTNGNAPIKHFGENPTVLELVGTDLIAPAAADAISSVEGLQVTGSGRITSELGAGVTVRGDIQLDLGAANVGEVPTANADGTWSWA